MNSLASDATQGQGQVTPVGSYLTLGRMGSQWIHGSFLLRLSVIWFRLSILAFIKIFSLFAFWYVQHTVPPPFVPLCLAVNLRCIGLFSLPVYPAIQSVQLSNLSRHPVCPGVRTDWTARQTVWLDKRTAGQLGQLYSWTTKRLDRLLD